jgi:predicted ATP-grasp superfamily ATP-dependent carboligase
MTSPQPILIAAWSGRMLAAAARRAGYLPLVVDSFADSDLSEHAHLSRHLPEAIHAGFHARSLFRALDDLAAAAPNPPAGLVLGTGFEETPDLVRRLSERYRLLGCGAEAVHAAKDPTRLFALLVEMGIRHPETSLTPPTEAAGWLRKRIGGSGGTHIREYSPEATAGAKKGLRRYYQRRADGMPLSVMAIMSPRGEAVAFTRQWASPAPRQPYRYGGATGHLTLHPDLEAELVSIVLPLGRRLGLAGLVSFDFLVGEDGPLLLDVNPRPGATLDVLDDDEGTLFAAHVAAVTGEDAASLLARSWRPRHRAAAYLYADQGDLTIPELAWPEWVRDRPQAGAVIAAHHPVATVVAEAESPEIAESRCRRHLVTLAEMLYGHGCPCSSAEHRD